MWNTDSDCHRTWPPTADRSQVSTLIRCQPLVTYSGLSVAVESQSCQVTNQPPHKLSFPLTCRPWVVARAILLEEIWFEMRGYRVKWLPVTQEGGPETHQHLREGCHYLDFFICSHLIRLPISGFLPACWRQLFQKRKRKENQGISLIIKYFVELFMESSASQMTSSPNKNAATKGTVRRLETSTI